MQRRRARPSAPGSTPIEGCGGRLRLIATVEDPQEIREVLAPPVSRSRPSPWTARRRPANPSPPALPLTSKPNRSARPPGISAGVCSRTASREVETRPSSDSEARTTFLLLTTPLSALYQGLQKGARATRVPLSVSPSPSGEFRPARLPRRAFMSRLFATHTNRTRRRLRGVKQG